jgi:hypothetical protein
MGKYFVIEWTQRYQQVALEISTIRKTINYNKA